MYSEDEIKQLVQDVLARYAEDSPVVGAGGGQGTVGGGSPIVDTGEAPDVSAVATKDEFYVPHPANRQGYLDMKQTTVARIGVWRAGARYNTWSMLHARADHATAQDAVFTDVAPEFLKAQGLIDGQTECTSRDEFLTRPDLGRKLNEETRAKFKAELRSSAPVTVMVGDGLSSSAMVNVPDILPAIVQGLKSSGIEIGPVPFVKYCRVGAMDDLGSLLDTDVVCLLIGERPGLATSESMSAYTAYRPSADKPESWRTVVSNIYRGGTPPTEAGAYLATLIKRMLDEKVSGVDLRL